MTISVAGKLTRDQDFAQLRDAVYGRRLDASDGYLTLFGLNGVTLVWLGPVSGRQGEQHLCKSHLEDGASLASVPKLPRASIVDWLVTPHGRSVERRHDLLTEEP